MERTGPDLAWRQRRDVVLLQRIIFGAAVLGCSLPPLASGECKLVSFASLRVTMTDRKPLIDAKINGADVRFIVDSGSFFSILAPSAARNLNLRLMPAPSSLAVRGIGGDVSINVAIVKDLVLADYHLSTVDFLVGGSELGSGAAGVIGQNLLRSADVEYDLANGLIRLMRPEGCKRGPLVYWQHAGPYSEMPIAAATAAEPQTIGSALLNGTKIRIAFDSGAGTSIVSRSAAERVGIKLDGDGIKDGGYVTGFGSHAVRSWIVPVASFAIGNEDITQTRLRVGDTDLTQIDMLLGADFFLSHRIYVARSQLKLYFTYNGGPVFNLTAATTAKADAAAPDNASARETTPEGEPTTAEEFARRGAAFAARRNYEEAVRALTRACELAPDNPKHFYKRALAYSALQQWPAAMDDLNRADTLLPNNAETLIARASARAAVGDRAGAAGDLQVAESVLPRDSDLRRLMAHVFRRLDMLDQEISELDSWLATHPGDGGRAAALNDRCWARALEGRELALALADCNAALDVFEKSGSALDSRALVRLRLGDLRGSLSDYDAAIRINPKSPWSLYGRGITKLRVGRAEEGAADVAAAKALDPGIADAAAKWGIRP